MISDSRRPDVPALDQLLRRVDALVDEANAAPKLDVKDQDQERGGQQRHVPQDLLPPGKEIHRWGIFVVKNHLKIRNRINKFETRNVSV